MNVYMTAGTRAMLEQLAGRWQVSQSRAIHLLVSQAYLEETRRPTVGASRTSG